MTVMNPQAGRDRTGRGPGLFVPLLNVAMLGAVCWALDFRVMALASRDCPIGGCFAAWGPIGAPLIAVAGLLAGLVITAAIVRYRRDRHVVWLFWLVVVQWFATIVFALTSSLD